MADRCVIYTVFIVLQLVLLSLSELSPETRIRENLLREYDRLSGPMSITGEPLNVSVSVLMTSIGPLNEAEMILEMRAIIRMTWQDPRFVFEDDSVTLMLLPGSFRHEIWVPDLFFPAAKKFELVSNVRNNGFIRISYDGTVLMSLDAEIEHKCPLDLYRFPLDTQVCSLIMESYGYTTNHLVFQWISNYAVEGSDRLKMNQFKVTRVEKLEYSVLFSTGTFSDLEVKVTLVRALLYYFALLYFPATVIVTISWIALWVPRGAMTQRLAIGTAAVLSMLVVCNMGNVAKNGGSVVTFADLYLALCFLQVFGALVTCMCQSLFCNCCSTRKNESEEDDISSSGSADNKNSAPICDKILGTIFPASFILVVALSIFSA